jgi:hypothetical protein
MYFGGGSYYYLIIALQVFCAVHSYRRGTLNRWIFLIIFLPVIGSIIYIYSEILSNRGGGFKSRTFSPVKVKSSPANIKKLEEQLHFTDTFANKVKLADAYLAAGDTDKAIDLYKASLTGAFAENEHVMGQLIVAYFEQQRYDEVIPLAKKLRHLQQFVRSKSHLLYALSLEETGNLEEAEKEFRSMKGRYSYFEQRYQYGLFLMRTDRNEDAAGVFLEMVNEEPHLGQVEKKANRTWFLKAREELKKISAIQKTA